MQRSGVNIFNTLCLISISTSFVFALVSKELAVRQYLKIAFQMMILYYNCRQLGN